MTTGTFINITTNPGSNILSSILLSNNGIYLATWCIQMTVTSLPDQFYSNIAYNTSATATSPLLAPNGNWGNSHVVSNAFMSTSGSIVFQGTAGNYCNLRLTISGGGTLGIPGGTYNITRVG